MFSKRLDRITPSATLAMTAKAAELRNQGINVLNLSVGEPDFNTPDNIIQAAKNAIDKGYTKYTPGSGIFPLKEAVCNKLSRDNKLSYKPEEIIVSCGGKHALYNACQVLFESGDEVIIFSPYWVSFPDFVSVTGARPIFVDTLSTNQYEPNFNDLESKITSKTKAIMPVHYAGGVGDLDAVYEFADTHGLRVVEDAAHAFGTTYNGKKVGSFGDIACFSFDGIKNITSGEGGCIVTDDQMALKRIRDARLLGVEGDTDKRFSGERSWDPDVSQQGWRYHMSDIMAAIGKEQLANFHFHKTRRQEIAKCYTSRLGDIPSVSMLDHDYDNVVPHIFVILLREGTDRAGLIRFLEKNGIPAGIHYKPNHLLTYFSNNSKEVLPITDMLYPRLLTLPIHPEIENKTVNFVVDILKTGIEYVR